MKVMRPVKASNGVLYLQMRSVRSHSTSEREKVGKKEKKKKERKDEGIFRLFMAPLRIRYHFHIHAVTAKWIGDKTAWRKNRN